MIMIMITINVLVEKKGPMCRQEGGDQKGPISSNDFQVGCGAAA